MSAIGTKRTSLVALHMPAFGGKADIGLNCGPLLRRPTSTIRSQHSSKSGFLSSSRGSVRSATALYATPDFWWAMGRQLVTPAAQTQTIEQMIELLQTAPPWRRDLEPIYSSLAARKKPVDWPAPGSEIEDQLFAVCTVIFVNPTQSERALNALRQALGGKRCEYVLALLAFIRTAHFWTVVHPGIAMEDDVKELLGEYKELAALLLQEPDPWSA